MAIMVALLTTVFVALAALVVDHGLAADMQRRAQNAADAAALAAAVVLAQGGSPSDADLKARQYASADFGLTDADWASCTTTLPSGFAAVAGSPCISANAVTRQVRVVLPRRTFATIFAGIAGYSSQTVTQAATAGWQLPDAGGCGLCVLDSLDSNTGSVQATGDVYAANMTFNNVLGSVTATGGTIYYSGTVTKGSYDPGPPVKAAALADPYLGIAPPVIDTAKAAIAAPTGPCSPANYYTDVSACTSFAPGVYVVGGGTESLNASADGVMFYLTCQSGGGKKGGTATLHPCAAAGEAGGDFGGAGNDGTVLTGLADPTSPWNGFAVVVDRNNTTQQTWVGNGTLAVTGIMYDAAVAGVTDKGNGLDTVTGRMVVRDLHLDGAGTLKYHIDVHSTAGVATPSLARLPHLVQ